MPPAIKDQYNKAFFDVLTQDLDRILHHFDKASFLSQIYDKTWEQKALKQRMRHIAMVLARHLPADYTEAIKLIIKLVQLSKKHQDGLALAYMFLPEFVALYGLDDIKTSTKAIEEITQFTSCEFAVRPFIIQYPQQMMQQMLAWSEHRSPHVRRLSSEACRPRLPWATTLAPLKKDPALILPILEKLKQDESKYVRTSLANNLNDISKDHPDITIAIAKRWKGLSPNTDWIIKHACRTLLKQGNTEVMQLFGFGHADKILVEDMAILSPQIHIGEDLIFRFKLTNTDSKSIKLRLEYAIYYQKANGSLSKKVYKISEKAYPKHSTTAINRKQSFKPISTRKFHAGLHQLAIIINGTAYHKIDFYVTK